MDPRDVGVEPVPVASTDMNCWAASYEVLRDVKLPFAKQKAQKQGLAFWDATAKRAVINLAIPLIAGAAYCFILLYHNQVAFIAPATLIFYGLALLNSSKYTIGDIGYLGVWQLVLGLLASFFIDFGLLFWAFGFGLLHLVYGILIYFKYEK